MGNWDTIAKLRETNRGIYRCIETLVGKPEGDATLELMKRLYAAYPALAKAVHRDIIQRDRVIGDLSGEIACE